MAEKIVSPQADPAISSEEIGALVRGFSQIGRCACAVLDPSLHRPVFHTGWRSEWKEFSSVVPNDPERFFAALSKLNWAEAANRPVLKFESAGHLVHAIAPVHTDGTLRCFLYAGYILATRPDDAEYVTLARERKYDAERFLHIIHDLPVLPENALTASLRKLVTQMNSLLQREPKRVNTTQQPPAPVASGPSATPDREADAATLDADSVAAFPWMNEERAEPSAVEQHTETASVATMSDESGMHAQIIRSLTRDIRTALNGSIGITGMLMRRREPEVLEMLETVHRSNDTLLTMLDNLHDYFDLISDQMLLMEAPFDLRIATERAVDSVRKRIEETGLKLNIRFAENTPTIVNGDAARLQQLLKTSLVTVARYSIGGRLNLAIRSNPGDSDSHEIQFLIQNVVDSPNDFLLQIDDDPALKVYDSADIGVVVCREIVGLLGGKMVVRTNEPPSIVFSLLAPEIRLDGYTFDTAVSQLLQQRLIAVVDDDETQLAALSLQCGYWGPAVTSFTSVEAAFTWLNKNKPIEALIISHTVPVKDALLSKLKSSRLHSDLHVIVYHGDRPAANVHSPADGSYDVAVWENLRQTLEGAMTVSNSPRPQPDSLNNLADLYPNSMMVVEDDPMNRQLIERILKKLGYAPVIATNGIEAVKAAGQKSFDLIFMDLQMPGMDGITATKTILSDTAHPKQPKIMALSANAAQTDRESAFRAGMVDFLAKPILLNNLQNAIIKWGHSAAEAEPSSVSSGGQGSSLVDVDVIIQTRELDQFSEESILDRLILGFIKEVPSIIDELEKGFTSNNTYKVSKATATIIGMSRNLGVKEFSRLAKDLESSAASTDLTVISKKLKALRQSYKNTCTELKLYLSGPN